MEKSVFQITEHISFRPEDGGSIVLRNVGILHHYTASEPRRPLHDLHRSENIKPGIPHCRWQYIYKCRV